ncbi:MAG: GNAT family N-acetyltransferase [Leptolyngbyaceae bacterium]|nr:GNAT family N-acetyltransferase [Leptolyngbyaceae bacterium]
MTVLTQRLYVGAVDHVALADFLNLCAEFDQLDSFTTPESLELSFTAPGVNPQQDVCFWEDSDGQLIAFCAIHFPQEEVEPLDGSVWFRIHPDARRKGLMSDILTWAEHRVRQVGRDRQLPVQLRAGSRATLRYRIEGLEAHGFRQDRCFHTLQRSLNTPISTPDLPDGFTIRQFLGKDEVENWVEMFNQSFIDHWNHHPLTVERTLHWLKDPDYRPELDLVAIAPDGTLAAFCYCSIDTAYNQKKNCREGWVDLLGTRRGFRRKGLGRALLLEGLARLSAAGMDTAKIGVDSQNPNRAYVLYESVGFQLLHSGLSFVKELSE